MSNIHDHCWARMQVLEEQLSASQAREAALATALRRCVDALATAMESDRLAGAGDSRGRPIYGLCRQAVECARAALAADRAEPTAQPKLYRCTICGQVGTVGRCCGLETRAPVDEPTAQPTKQEVKP